MEPASSRSSRQTAAQSLTASLPAGHSLLFYTTARTASPYELTGFAGSPGARPGAGKRLRGLLSGDREKERGNRAVSAAVAAAGGIDFVAELWAVVVSKDGADGQAQSYVVVRALDNGVAPAAVVVRMWSLLELRLIDGLGLDAATARQFSFTFGGQPAPMVLHTDNPRARARFLWSVSQIFAQKLKRAPPTTGLLLLDLQQVADNSGPPTVTVVSAALQTGALVRGQGSKNVSFHAGDDESLLDYTRTGLGGTLPPTSRLSAVVLRSVSEPSPQKAARPAVGVRLRGGVEMPGEGAEFLEGMEYAVVKDMDPRDGPAAQLRKPAERSVKSVGATIDSSDFTTVDIEQRAFLVAASRLGGMEEDGGMPALAAKRRRDAEKRSFHISFDEAQDLDAAVTSDARKEGCPGLSGFTDWLSRQIADLELTNISETLSVEEDTPALSEPLFELKDVLLSNDTWFRKCEARLAPHAVIVQDAQDEYDAVEIQRRNVGRLQQVLAAVLASCSLTEEEEAVIDKVLADFTTKGVDVRIFSDFFSEDVIPCAIGTLALKANQETDSIINIESVEASRSLLLEKRDKLAGLMMSSLRAAAVEIADGALLSDHLSPRWVKGRAHHKLAAFSKAAQALVTLDARFMVKLETMCKEYGGRDDSVVNSGMRLHEVWSTRRSASLPSRLGSLFKVVTSLCQAEGDVLFQMFRLATETAGKPVEVLIDTILAHQFSKLSSAFDMIVEGEAGNNSQAVLWTAYLEVDSWVDDKRKLEKFLPDMTEMVLSPSSQIHANGNMGLFTSNILPSEGKDKSFFDCRSYLVSFLRSRAKRYEKMVNMKLDDVIGAIPLRTADIIRESWPEKVFSTVQALGSMCIALAEAWAKSDVGRQEEKDLRELKGSSGVAQLPRGLLVTKKKCDRLITAAFMRIESSVAHGQHRPEKIKLDCYTYLSESLHSWTAVHTDLLFGEAEMLAGRGRLHATSALAVDAHSRDGTKSGQI